MSEMPISLDPYSCVANTVGSIVKEITNYLEVKELNKTERIRIEAALETAIKYIESENDKFKFYLEKEYEDKNRLYINAEKLIDKGMQDNNINIINIGCNLMMGAFNKNPLKEYNDKIDFTAVTATYFQKVIED